MARNETVTTPTHPRRASTAEPFIPSASITNTTTTTTTHRRQTILLRTPGSSTRTRNPNPTPYRPGGLSASGRKQQPLNATPHARAAFRTVDARRAAILTPHRARRRSLREVRDSPRDFLLSLGRVLARGTEVITTSSSTSGASSSPDGETTVSGRRGGRRRSGVAGGGEEDDEDGDPTLGAISMLGDGDEDDDDDEEMPKRPRLSLPIGEEDEDDDSDDLQPHRSVLFDDDNFTMQSIEMPRRALSEQPGGRFSMGSVRMSDYFNTNDMLHSEDVGVDSGFFPPTAILDEGNVTMGVEELASPERLESEADRRDLGRESDFGIEIPLGDANESTFVIAPQVQDSPERPLAAEDGPGYEDFAPLVDQRSDDFDDEDLLGDMPALADEEPVEGPSHGFDDATEVDASQANRAELRGGVKKIKVSKYGMEYPSLPPAVVKRLAQGFAKAGGAQGKITPDAMKAIMQASDWFFEQLGEDLQAYAKHAGRKTIDETDVLTLMKRQRQINPSTTPFALAQRHLPRELLQELRMPPPAVPSKRRRTKGAAEDEDVT